MGPLAWRPDRLTRGRAPGRDSQGRQKMATTRPTEPTDLILKGGHVIDPQNHLDGKLDVALADGKVERVAPDLAPGSGATVLDVSGSLVTPGIVDMHCHVFHTHPRSRLSLHPEVNTLSAGVTTVVDAGTAGWRDFADFREQVVQKSKVRVLAWVNVVGRGMGGDWEQDVAEMKPRLAAAIARDHPDLVVGIKAAHYWTRHPFDAAHEPWAAVDRALEAGELSGKPIMVDFWPRPPERPYEQLILEKLRPGDVHTHVFAQQFRILDDSGRVADYLFEARRRGVIFDLGHGAGSFWFRNAAPAIRQGFVPDSISTDLHTGNVSGPVFDMLTTMNKLLCLGVPLTDVIARSTVAPAQEIGHPELGSLSPGSDADVAVFKLEEGVFPYLDCGRAKLTGDRRLRCVLTIRAGRVVYNPLGLGLPEWEEAPAPYWVIPALQA